MGLVLLPSVLLPLRDLGDLGVDLLHAGLNLRLGSAVLVHAHGPVEGQIRHSESAVAGGPGPVLDVEMLAHPIDQARNIPEIGGDSLLRRGLAGRPLVSSTCSRASFEALSFSAYPVRIDASPDSFRCPTHLLIVSVDQPREPGGELLARPRRQYDERLEPESHELVRRAIPVIPEDAQLVIGQLNRAHAAIAVRTPIPIHPECAPLRGRPPLWVSRINGGLSCFVFATGLCPIDHGSGAGGRRRTRPSSSHLRPDRHLAHRRHP